MEYSIGQDKVDTYRSTENMPCGGCSDSSIDVTAIVEHLGKF